MKKLGIIGAMKVEVETLQEKMEHLSTREIAGMTFFEGTLEGLPAVVVQCGVGKVNAAMCAQILCACFRVTHLVNTGIAGSLCKELDICDLVVSREAMYYDVDCHTINYPVGKVPGMPLTYASDEQLRNWAVAAAEAVNPGHTRVGRIATGDQFVASRELKAHIISVTQALCTEMEGAAIAQTAYRNGVPFVILRAISDKADDSAEMDYPTFEALAAVRCAQITLAMARQIREAD